MDSEQGKKNGTALVLVREWDNWQQRTGGKRRALTLPPRAEHQLNRDMHCALVSVRGKDGHVPSRAVQDIREQRTGAKPWRTLAKRFWEMRAAGAPLDAALNVLRTFEQWVVKLWGGEQPA